jgi:DNA-3-methyladenine glycosylase II
MCRFEIEVASPFRLDLTVWALRRRPHNAIDRWDGACYRRTLVLADQLVEVGVCQQQGPTSTTLTVELRGSSAALSDDAVAEVHRVLERTLGIGVDLGGFYRMAERDDRLSALARRFCGVRPPCFPSVFEAVVNAIACQQLSLVVGIHLLNGLAERFGPTLSVPGARPGFPTPERLAGADPQVLRELGFSRAKASAATVLARRVAGGDVDLEALRDLDDGRALATLQGLAGIGRWSAEYTLLRGLGRYHVLPGDDVGARNSLSRRFGLGPGAGYDAVAELARSWSPYGGLVYVHLLLDTLAATGHVTPSFSGDSATARVRSANSRRQKGGEPCRSEQRTRTGKGTSRADTAQ